MEATFWKDRWKEGRIGFHEGRPNALLTKHVHRLPAPPARVFVPLCGKAEDMAFLAARGYAIVGVDLVESALRDFFREHELEPEESKDDRFVTLRSGPFTLMAGDLFDLTAADVGGAACAYDRASIVALPPEMRGRYAARLREILPKGAPILTVTFDYDESRFTGPPFAVGEAELRRLYAGAEIELLEPVALPPASTGALAQADVGATEKIWLVTP